MFLFLANILGLISIFLANFAYANCENRNAPLCPDKGAMILNELYPTSAFIVSTATRDYSSKERMAPNFLIEVMEAYNYDVKILPALIIPTSKGEFQELQKDLTKRLESKKISKEKSAQLLTSLRHLETSSYLWQQDYLQSYFDPTSGAPIAGIVSRYDRTPLGMERGLTNLQFNCSAQESLRIGSSQIMRPHSAIGGSLPSFNGGQAMKFGMPSPLPEGMQEDQWYEGEPGTQNSKMGGNIESLPGGICLTGDNMSDEYLSEWCRDLSMAVKVETSWLTVGHVDELVKLVPSNNGSAPCNFAIMIASPDKALEILKKDSNESFYTFTSDRVNTRDFNLMSKLTPSFFPGEVMCKLYTQKIRDLQNSEEQNGTTGRRVKTVLLWQAMVNTSFAKTSSDQCYQELAKMKSITNGQYYQALIEDAELMETNRLIQEKMNRAKKEITNKLKQALPQCRAPKFIDVPNLFATDGLVDGKKGKELPIPGSANSILPNPTNSVVANQTVIFPHPNNLSFKAYLSQEMSKLKIKSAFVDTWDTSHLGHGNLHCITNNFNYCKPRP